MKISASSICLLMGYLFISRQPGDSFADSADIRQGKVVIEIEGMASRQGQLRIALINSKDSFDKNDNSFEAKEMPIEAELVECILPGISYGEYAVKVYHDENSNRKLDKLPFLGIPLERYGFSNNARASFGPPSFEEAAFMLDQQEVYLRIKVN